jgi:hypothetical protein
VAVLFAAIIYRAFTSKNVLTDRPSVARKTFFALCKISTQEEKNVLSSFRAIEIRQTERISTINRFSVLCNRRKWDSRFQLSTKKWPLFKGKLKKSDSCPFFFAFKNNARFIETSFGSFFM